MTDVTDEVLNPVELEEEEDEEGIKAKGALVPTMPSQEEVEAHMLTHVPYRSWCKHCVRGKAKGKPHFRTGAGKDEVPCVVLDYMSMKGGKEEDSDDRGMPILVAKDMLNTPMSTGMVFARVVPHKGRCPYAIKSLAADVGALGYSQLVLKSDGEPAVQALKEAVKAERPEKIVLESSPVGESQSNGGAECAIQLVQGQFRAMKDSLEARIGTRIAEDSPVVPWLIMHAARTMNRYTVGADGKTPYRRWKGKDFKRDVAEFGEAVLFQKSGSRGVDKHDCR